MRLHRTLLGAAGLALAAAPAAADDAARGARLYLGLPGGEASCVECHGPDPGLDRNRLLNGARGAFAIDEALRKAAAMGYLAELLGPADRADLSAFLALVAGEVDGSTPVLVWPWGLEFGRVAAGSAVAPQPVRLLNRGGDALALAPRLRALAPEGASGLTLAHDCPPLLAPGEGCTAQVGLVAGGSGRVQAALVWGDGAAAALRPVGLAATVGAEVPAAARWIDPVAGAVTDAPVRLAAAPGSEARVELALENPGPGSLVLGVPAITGPGRAAFRLLGGSCVANAMLAPGGRCTVRLAGAAPAAGVAEALLQWRNDGGHAAPRRLELRADGTAAPPPPAPPAPAPSPVPAPTPVPDPAATVDAPGGGCSRVALGPARPDPLLPGLVLLAAGWAAWRARVPARRP